MYGYEPYSTTPFGAFYTAPSGPSTVTGVVLAPANATIPGGGSLDFDWVVTGTNGPSQAVTLTTTLGTIDANGLLTVPAATGDAQSGTVTATSAQDPTKRGTATFTIPAAGGTLPNRTVRIVFGNESGLAVNLVGVSVSFYDEPMPHLATIARYQSGTETTDADGALQFTFPSSLDAGDEGLLTVNGPNGVHYNGPWSVA